jgi:phosphoribosylformylglycinamidine synthase
MCELDPFTGAAMAIAEVCRNLVCTGAEPIGITDCLNFGNPERPEIMDSFARAVDGIAAACDALGVPVVSGNVSLYNETARAGALGSVSSQAILPTPTVAAVGLIASAGDIVTSHFKRAGDVVLLLGPSAAHASTDLGGSEWLVKHQRTLGGPCPTIDLALEARLQKLLLSLARAGLVRSAHDASDGGLAVALAECCQSAPGGGAIGAAVDVPAQESAADAVAGLFGEGPSRVVVSVGPGAVQSVLAQAGAFDVEVHRLGITDDSGVLSIGAAPLGGFSVTTSDIATRRASCLSGIVGLG